jgi:hypothetical protein
MNGMQSAVAADGAPTATAAKEQRRRPLVVAAPVCADCRFSEVHALQARTHCAHPNAALHGATLFAGQPACEDFVAREARDYSLSAYRAQGPTPLA